MGLQKRTLHESQLTAVDLVWSILAINASVTPPAAVDTLPIFTLEVVDAAVHSCLLRLPSHTVLWPLVRPIGTVLVSIAPPLGQHTRWVVTLKGTSAAGGFGAGSLIWAVWTVVVTVANVGGGYTLAVGAAKLASSALFGGCGEAAEGEERL